MERVVFESVRKSFRSGASFFARMRGERSPETIALRNLSFATAPGEVLVLLGPNGSGKTTTLKLISTMLLPDAGSVRVAGFDTRQQAREVRRRVGIAVAAERSFFPRLSARENLDFFAALDEVPRGTRSARIAETLHEVGLDGQAETLAMKFSSGMYQRLGIARALLKRPEVLLFDEPTRSLDPASTAHLWTTIRSLAGQGASVVLASHNFGEAAAAGDRLLLLQNGELLAERAIRRDEGAEDLRTFYFEMTGEIDEMARVMMRAG